MGTKLAAYDSSGNIIGYYDTDDSPLPFGLMAIEITDAQWQECISSPGWIVVDNALVAPPAASLNQVQASGCIAIDAAADTAYIVIGGPSPGRLAEYQQASADASAFKASGYIGTVPVTVSCWAQANTGWTDQQAADDIIATAQKWISALQGIRSARLLGKYAVMQAATVAAAQEAAHTAITNVQTAAEAA